MIESLRNHPLAKFCRQEGDMMSFYYRAVDNTGRNVVLFMRLSVVDQRGFDLDKAEKYARKKVMQSLQSELQPVLTNITYEEYQSAKGTPEVKSGNVDGRFEFSATSLFVYNDFGFEVGAGEKRKRFYYTFKIDGDDFKGYSDIRSIKKNVDNMSEQVIKMLIDAYFGWTSTDVKMISEDEYSLIGRQSNAITIQNMVGEDILNKAGCSYAERLVVTDDPYYTQWFYSERWDHLKKSTIRMRMAVQVSYNGATPTASNKDELSLMMLGQFIDAKDSRSKVWEVSESDFINNAPHEVAIVGKKDKLNGSINIVSEIGPTIAYFMDNPVPAWIKRDGKTLQYEGIKCRGYILRDGEVEYNSLIYK